MDDPMISKQPKSYVCTHCNAEYDKDINMCKLCGHMIMDVTVAVPTTPPKLKFPKYTPPENNQNIPGCQFTKYTPLGNYQIIPGCQCTRKCALKWHNWKCPSIEFISGCTCSPKCHMSYKLRGWVCWTEMAMEM